MTSPGGELTAPTCHQTKKVKKAEELNYLSSNISCMLSDVYAECHLCLVSFMLSVIYAECRLCWVSFMLSVIYAECHLFLVSFMLSVIYAECCLCWVSFMLSVIYAECCLCWVSFMLSVIYAECRCFFVSMVCVVKPSDTFFIVTLCVVLLSVIMPTKCLRILLSVRVSHHKPGHNFFISLKSDCSKFLEILWDL